MESSGGESSGHRYGRWLPAGGTGDGGRTDAVDDGFTNHHFGQLESGLIWRHLQSGIVNEYVINS